LTFQLSKKNSIKNFLNTILALSFIGLILARDVFGTPVNDFVFVALSAIFFITNDISLTIAAMAFLIPLYNGVQYVTIYSIGIAILALKNSKDYSFKPILLICAATILIIEIFSGFNTNVTLDITELFRIFIIFILTFVFLPSYKKDLNYSLILKSYVLGTLFMGIIIMWQYLTAYDISDFFDLTIRVGNVESHFHLESGLRVSNDPNLLGIFTSIAICTALILNYQQTVSKLYLFFIPFFLLFGFFTQSRTFIFSVILLFVYYIFASFLKGSAKNAKKAVSSLLITVVLLAGTFLIVNALSPQYISNLTIRFEVDDITNGRTVIFQAYNDFLRDNPRYIPFGAGLNYHIEISQLRATHNGFQQVLVSWGIVGCLIIAIMMVKLYKNASLSSKLEPMHLLPMVMYLLPMQSIQWFSSAGMVLLNIMWFYSVRLLTLEQSRYHTSVFDKEKN